MLGNLGEAEALLLSVFRGRPRLRALALRTRRATAALPGKSPLFIF
jgi:hypothetical protein